MSRKIFAPDRLELGLGLLSIGRTWGVGQSDPPDESGVRELLGLALELGIRIFDTAPAYASSEARFGRFLRELDPERRKDVVVMTKAGEHWNAEGGTSFVDHTRDSLCRSIDRSLDHLGSIDVLQIHKATREVVRDPGVLAALDHARTCGILTFGASVSDIETGLAAIETGAYQVLQFPLNAANRSLARLLPVLRDSGRSAILNRPFAMGSVVEAAERPDLAARAAFRFIRDTADKGVVLTGTGKAGHLAENVVAFRDALAAGPGGTST